VYPSAVMMPAVLTRYEKASGLVWASVEFVLYAYVLLLTTRLIIEICGNGPRKFFASPLNWVEFVNQVTFMLVFALRIASEMIIAPKYDSLGHAGGESVSLFSVAYVERSIDNVMAFNAVLMYIRLLKFLSINPNVNKIVQIFGAAIRALIYLLFVVFILLFAYALAFHLLFRTTNEAFATIGASMMTVIRSVLGDFPIIELEGTNAFLARVLFVSYMVVLFFIVLNMFIAVLSEVAHVYSLQPTLDEYREWAKMKRLVMELLCCCLGYGQNGDSVVDDDSDDEADKEVEEEAQAMFGKSKDRAKQDRLKEAEEIKKRIEENAAEVEEISEAAKLNQRMAAVEIALSSIGDVVMEKAARKQEKKREKEREKERQVDHFPMDYMQSAPVEFQRSPNPEFQRSPERERPKRPASRGGRRPSKAIEPVQSPLRDTPRDSPQLVDAAGPPNTVAESAAQEDQNAS